MRIANVSLFTDVNMGADAFSPIIALEDIYGLAAQMEWTGSPVGNFTVEASCDAGQILSDGTITGVTNFTTLANSSSAAGGAPGNLLYNVNLAFYRFVRVRYTRTSGTGTLNGRISVKGV